MKIAILTCDRLKDLTSSDQKILAMLLKSGLDAQATVWDDENIDWESFDYLIFRNTWDYYEKETAFLAFLDYIERLNIPTLNSLPIVRKNIHKFYLRDFENKGIKIIPTVFIEKGSTFSLSELKSSDWPKAVIKPAFSAGSYLTEVVTDENILELSEQYNVLATDKDLLFQKFMPEIQLIGETSLLFFNRKFSHSVCKVPKHGDFRVQSQFGGQYSSTTVTENVMNQALDIINLVEGDLLFARIDGIIIDDIFYLMELELIEPDLYLEHHPEAYHTYFSELISKLQP
jgi:glutathione synthase/RimK-type ligase-like ATP-grasp enzyme